MIFSNKIDKPLAYNFYYIPVTLLSLAGLLNSVYLAFSHYRNYTDIGHISFCAISKAVNCDTVSQSHFSIFMGIPVPVWGIIGYLLLLFFVIHAGLKISMKQRGWPVVLVLSSIFSIYSVILAFISGYYIESYCILCILSYAINFLVMFYALVIRKRFDDSNITSALKADLFFFSRKKSAVLTVIMILALTISAFFYFPEYWKMKPSSVSEANLSTGLTQEGHPWIGAEKPVLIIEEYSDYQCFQCKKMHFFLRKLVASYPDKIRLVHRHYPMDYEYNNVIVRNPFHVGSGKLSLIAIVAAFRGVFWEVNDVLFEIAGQGKDTNIKKISQMTNMSEEDISIALNNRNTLEYLRRDIREGMKLNITATPALVVNKKVYIGELPSDIIRESIEK